MRAIFVIIFIISSHSLQAQIDTLFITEARYHHFNGNVGIYDGNQAIYEESFGNADFELQHSLGTRFDIGSISKQFTAAAVLHLQHQGNLSVDDPINKHLGKFSNKKWKKVTIHHLLTHSSGIPSLFQTEQGLELVYATEEAVSLETLISFFFYGDLLFKPGEEFTYSNSGYILLAAIIQEVSGMSYFEFMEEAIFKGYGLQSTGFDSDSGSAKPFYGYLPVQQKPAPVYHKSWLIGAGGIYSTLRDLSKWIQTINSDDFLTEELRQLFLSPKVNAGNGIKYGYGWQFTPAGVIEHDGGNAGFISFLSFDPANGQHHVLLTNRSFESIHDLGKSSEKIRSLSNQIWRWRRGQTLEIHPNSSTISIPPSEISMLSTETLAFSIDKDGAINVTSKIPLLRLVAQTPLESTSSENKRLVEIAEHLENHNFWKFAKYCDSEMKFVAYSGLFRYGFGMMKKQVGSMEELIPYSMDGDRGYLRMIGDQRILDLVVYFDEQGKVMGVFENGSYPVESQTKFILYPVGGNTFWIDGFPYGEHSAFIVKNGTYWMIEQFGRTVAL